MTEIINHIPIQDQEELSEFSQERRRLLKGMGILGGLIISNSVNLAFAACVKKDQPTRNPFEKEYEYAAGTEVTLNLFLTSKEGKEAAFKEKAIELVPEKVVRVRKNLEAVDASSVKPLLVNSSVEQIAGECDLDSLPIPVRVIFIDAKMDVQGGQYKTTQQADGLTSLSKDGKYIIIVVSVGAAFEESVQGRIARGESKVEPARLASDTMYHLSRIFSHELYHAGKKHYLISDRSLAQKAEKETTDYGNDFSIRVQSKQLPPPVVIQHLPAQPK